MPQLIPTQPIANQELQVQLAGQPCTLHIYQTMYGLFVDVTVGDVLIIGGVIGLNLNRIVRSEYLGFDGDLVFRDTQGADDPVYTGLGARFDLVYLEATELTAAGL